MCGLTHKFGHFTVPLYAFNTNPTDICVCRFSLNFAVTLNDFFLTSIVCIDNIVYRELIRLRHHYKKLQCRSYMQYTQTKASMGFFKALVFNNYFWFPKRPSLDTNSSCIAPKNPFGAFLYCIACTCVIAFL